MRLRQRARLILKGAAFALIFGIGAVPHWGIALSVSARPSQSQSTIRTRTRAVVPASVSFREDNNRGLLVQGWINGEGPFTVAIDTGAGFTVVSEAIARQTRLRFSSGPSAIIAGISGSERSARRATIDRIALGDVGNEMPGSIQVVVAETLPTGVDAVVDPTELYSPLGYSIDLPNRRITAFDPIRDGLTLDRQPANGTIVRWQRDGTDRRPFIRLGDRRLALIDTGSNFGLAINEILVGNRNDGFRQSKDLGGGTFRSNRVAPTTVTIGSLVLNGVPTDILSGTNDGVPILLGRDALNPFVISFDPRARLIEIVPPVQDKYRPR